MDLYKLLWEAFNMDARSMQDLLQISFLIDEEKSGKDSVYDESNEANIIASTIVALRNNRNLSMVGEKLYNEITKLIVQKNLVEVSLNDGENLYKKLKNKARPGTYKVKRTSSGCKFDLVASNGEILATSEVYSTVDSCIKGITAMRKNVKANIEDQTEEGYRSVANPKYEMYTDRQGEYRFRLKAMNGQIIAVSEGYATKELCVEAIERTKFSGDTMDMEKG